MYIYNANIYVYNIYYVDYTHVIAREVRRILPEKPKHFLVFAPVICLWLYIIKSCLLWIQTDLYFPQS